MPATRRRLVPLAFLACAAAGLPGCTPSGGGAPDATGVCVPYATKCRAADLLMCQADGAGWILSDMCPLGCSEGACLSDGTDATGGGDATGERRGCLACACDFGEKCDAGLTCFAGVCVPRGCQVDGDCPDGRRCYLGGCIPKTCGDGHRDAGEACDDGNNRNGDGCNVNCDVEATRPLAGGEPLGFSADPGALPVAFSACDDETKTGPWAPGEVIPVRICAVSYLDAAGQGLSAAQVTAEVEAAGRFYSAGGSAIRLDLVRTDVVQAGPDQTDPDTADEIDALLRRLRQDADAAHPGECPVVLGYVHSMRDAGGAFGGMGSWPVTGIHTAAITSGNVDGVPGQTTAHELGHVIGLYHTFEPSTPDGDGCSDTARDANCLGGPPSCQVTCPDGSVPPAPNVMSYYFCVDPRADSFSACQARRARCFLSRMFPAAPCPLPVLQNPSEGQVAKAGEALAFSWKAGQADAAHEVVVRRLPSGEVAWQGAAGTETTLTLAGGTLEVGAYAWTVRYASSCCAGGTCEGVERRFSIAAVSCDGATSQACGRCGRQTRTCNADGTWSAFGPCTGQGECDPGDPASCPGGGSVACTADCAWPRCPDCVPDCAGACPGAGDGCGGTCAGNHCEGCCDGSACLPGDDASACGLSGGACRVCVAGAVCGDGSCDGCAHDEGEPAACGDNDTPACAEVLATLASEKDTWAPMTSPAAPSPAGDADLFLLRLDGTDFFAVLDPEVLVSNRSGVPLQACLWWRNADGSPAVLANGVCTGGIDTPHPADGTGWDGAPGCCVAVPDGVDDRGPHFYVTDATGEALVQVRAPGDGACGRYSFRAHL